MSNYEQLDDFPQKHSESSTPAIDSPRGENNGFALTKIAIIGGPLKEAKAKNDSNYIKIKITDGCSGDRTFRLKRITPIE